MKPVLLIAKKELASALYSSTGYLIVAIVLLIDGLLFNSFALAGEHKSHDVLFNFFHLSSGTTMVASVVVAMRLFAEEKQLGTLVLLETSPSSEHQIVLGKFLGAWGFVLIILALSLYMPLLILVNGKVTVGHMFSGYLGLALLGGACLAITTFASSIAKNQILAAAIGGAIIVALLLSWMIARKVEGTFGDIVGYLDLYDKHFRSFARGTVRAESVVYYVSLVYGALLATTCVLSARRWRA